jgi:hypothetical protein
LKKKIQLSDTLVFILAKVANKINSLRMNWKPNRITDHRNSRSHRKDYSLRAAFGHIQCP